MRLPRELTATTTAPARATAALSAAGATAFAGGSALRQHTLAENAKYPVSSTFDPDEA